MQIAGKRAHASRVKPAALLDFLAIFFVLLAPYLNYVRHNEFVFETVNYVLLAGFAVVAIVLVVLTRVFPSPVLRVAILAFVLFLFLDIQLFWIDYPVWKLVIGAPVLAALCWVTRQRINVVLAAAAGTVVASTLLFMLWSAWLAGDNETPARQADSRPDLPVYVHIILDEMAGPEAFEDSVPIQKAIKNEIRTFFAAQGFRLYGRAYSPYYDSQDSLAAVLNLETTPNPAAAYTVKGANFWITQNQYFDDLRARGYGIKVYQSNYIDYCSAEPGRIRSCITYNFDTAPSAALASLSEAEKARLMLTRYGNLYSLGRIAMGTYGWLRPRLAPIGLTLPKPTEVSDRLGPIPVMPVFERLIKDVATDARGNAYFAHLFIPHYPYSVDADCRIRRPVLAWPSRYIAPVDASEASAAQARLALYEAYIPQVRCALAKVQEVLDALQARGAYDGATIVVHGDHGSRIVRREPRTVNRESLSAQDINDGYLALYAVKSPGIAPGYDNTVVSLPHLVEALVRGGGRDTAAAPTDERARVFLRDGPFTDLVELPVPCLGGGEAAQAVAPATPANGLAPRCGTGQARSGPASAEDG